MEQSENLGNRVRHPTLTQFFLLGGGSRELIEVRGQDHNASNATTREFKIVNFSGGGFATPTKDHLSSNENTQTANTNDHPLKYFFPFAGSVDSDRTGGEVPGSQGADLWAI